MFHEHEGHPNKFISTRAQYFNWFFQSKLIFWYRANEYTFSEFQLRPNSITADIWVHDVDLSSVCIQVCLHWFRVFRDVYIFLWCCSFSTDFCLIFVDQKPRSLYLVAPVVNYKLLWREQEIATSWDQYTCLIRVYRTMSLCREQLWWLFISTAKLYKYCVQMPINCITVLRCFLLQLTANVRTNWKNADILVYIWTC